MADILDLPFEDDRFDAVIGESVIAFVDDKARAIRECVRVTRPGGCVGLNESFFTTAPTPEVSEIVRRELGVDIPLIQTWQTLWEASGLQNRVIRLHQIDARHEIQDRLQWIGARWTLKAFGRLSLLRNIGVIAQVHTSQVALSGPELATVVADLLIIPAWVIGGVLLWRRRAFGFVTGAGLLFQASMLFIGLLVFFILQPFLTAMPFPLVDFVVILVLGLVCFVPFGLFVRGALSGGIRV